MQNIYPSKMLGCTFYSDTIVSVAVWSCSWHWDGVALVSGSMDHTAKLWDTNKYGIVYYNS